MRAQSRALAWRKAGWPVFLACAFFYIGYHAVSGEHGIYAWMKESRRLVALQSEFVEIHARREAMERKVQLLSDDSLDLDMLDEQARAQLGFAGPNEVVILTPQKK